MENHFISMYIDPVYEFHIFSPSDAFCGFKEWRTPLTHFYHSQRNFFFPFTAKQSNEKFDASQLHDQQKRKHKTEILPDDGTGDVEVTCWSKEAFWVYFLFYFTFVVLVLIIPFVELGVWVGDQCNLSSISQWLEGLHFRHQATLCNNLFLKD